MKTIPATRPSPESQRMLDRLRRAIGNALERKQRLGQYAVTGQSGKPTTIPTDAGRTTEGAEPNARRD